MASFPILNNSELECISKYIAIHQHQWDLLVVKKGDSL